MKAPVRPAARALATMASAFSGAMAIIAACSSALMPGMGEAAGVGLAWSAHGTPSFSTAGAAAWCCCATGALGRPQPASVVSWRTSLPQKNDHGMPVTARNRITAPAKAPVTA